LAEINKTHFSGVCHFIAANIQNYLFPMRTTGLKSKNPAIPENIPASRAVF
jgi:hypothetical protein